MRLPVFLPPLGFLLPDTDCENPQEGAEDTASGELKALLTLDLGGVCVQAWSPDQAAVEQV